MSQPCENPYRSPSAASSEDARPRSPEELVARGRLLFLAIAGYFIVGSIIVLTLEQNTVAGTEDRFVVLLLQWAIALGLLFAAWRGHGWAMILLSLRCVFVILFILIALLYALSSHSMVLAEACLGFGVIEAGVLWTLVCSPSLNAFLRHQARQRGQEVAPSAETPIVTQRNPPAAGDDAIRALETLRRHNAIGGAAGMDAEAPEVEFACDECGGLLSFPGNRRGRVEVCRHCGHYVDVPR